MESPGSRGIAVIPPQPILSAKSAEKMGPPKNDADPGIPESERQSHR